MSAELTQRLTGEWLVVSIWGEPVDPHAPRSVIFETATVAGQVGVNRFSGSYKLDIAGIEIGMLVSTLMAGPTELMALEQRFGKHLPGVHALSLDGDRLILGEGDRSIRLSRAAPAISVQGTVTYRERMMLPPSSVVTVELVELDDSSTELVIASDVIADAAGPPVTFSLTTSGDRGRLAVRARIVSDRGDLLWASVAPVPVEPGRERHELLLRRVG